VLQAFYIKNSHIPPPIITPPSSMPNPQKFFLPEDLLSPKKQGYDQSSSSTSSLPQIFEIGESSRKTSLERHEEQIEGIQNHLDKLSLDRIEYIENRIEGLGDVADNVDISSLKCSLCNQSIQPRLEDIVSWLSPMATKRSFKSVVGKLLFAATAYVIWCERNNRLFKNTRRSPEELKDQIMVVVRLKLTTFRFKNKMVKSTIVTLQRVIKQRMTIETHNWASFAHQELHKIIREENFPIVNQVDARLQNFEIQFLKEAAKFVGDFKSLANEADASLAKHKALELEIERLLKAVVSQDIMIIVQMESVVDTSDLQTELERTKECFENCIIKKETEYAKLWNDWYKKCDECKYDKISYDKAYKDMQQNIEQLQA
nr:reverse transcriptase domain, reverse transcriptase zinc-binding domain protein [Tanacetum cinerariifolium]